MSAGIQGFHPYTDEYPMHTEGEYAKLKSSIESNGQRQPITVTPDGWILDGRNRYKACEELGRQVNFVVYEGGDVAEFVIDANTRRDMTDSQHAMVQACIYLKDGRRTGGRWVRGSVANNARVNNSDSWKSRLSEAGLVLDQAPELAEQVKNGAMPLREALREAELRRDAERDLLAEEDRIAAEEDAAREHLTATAPEYLSQHATARQALAAWEDDNKREAARIRQERAAADREAAERLDAASQLYTGIAKALSVISGYGNYATIETLMSEYDVTLLKPRSYASEFTPDSLAKAHKFISMLEEWEAAR